MCSKLYELKKVLSEMGSVVIAYSGGVDSTFLLRVAHEVLGSRVLAVTAESLTYPHSELEVAKERAREMGVRHMVIKTDELTDPRFTSNPVDRCYWCKKELFSKLIDLARENNLNYVLDGSNYDDMDDFRPGMEAARDLRVRSPLQEVGLGKEEIRSLSKSLGLTTWNKPSLACLASRFPYGTDITEEHLAVVDRAEEFIRSLGIKQVRVRHHNHIARIEVLEDDIEKILTEEVRRKIVLKFKDLGYCYITIDLEGYRTGSMNEVLGKELSIQ